MDGKRTDGRKPKGDRFQRYIKTGGILLYDINVHKRVCLSVLILFTLWYCCKGEQGGGGRGVAVGHKVNRRILKYCGGTGGAHIHRKYVLHSFTLNHYRGEKSQISPQMIHKNNKSRTEMCGH